MKRSARWGVVKIGVAGVFLTMTACVGAAPPAPPPASGRLPVPDPKAGSVTSDELTFIEIFGKKWDGKADLSSRRFAVVELGSD